MPSLSSVAKQAGVSITTASMVLNGGKRSERISEGCAQRVREAARQVGYVPNYHARSMKLGRAEMIGVAAELAGSLGPGRGELAAAYFGTLVGAIEVTARRAGYSMTMIGPDERLSALRRGVQAVRQRRLDGLIVLGAAGVTPPNLSVDDLGSDLIVMIEYAGPTLLPVIDWDQALGVKLAVAHLAKLGHQEILWLGPEFPSERSSYSIREQMFVTAAWDAGLRGASCRYPSLANSGPFPAEKWSDAAAQALGQYISERGKSFSAILCYNDVAALGAYRALYAAGLNVPEDVSVVGFDNIEAPLLIPKLTTVDHMLHEMGRGATEMLLEITKDPTQWPHYSGRRVVIAPELIVRESTRAPAKPGK